MGIGWTDRVRNELIHSPWGEEYPTWNK